MDIERLFSGAVAHAYVFHRDDAPGVVLYFERDHEATRGKKFGAHPNAVLYDVESFGIDDSRTVAELGNLQTDGDVFIAIVARSLTPEAQHALLKTFEEPKAGVHYLLFVEDPELLLPTLRSRCILAGGLAGKGDGEKKKSSHPDFLSIPLAERFGYIEKISKSLKKDDPNAFRDAALDIFDAVIAKLHEKSPAQMKAGERETLGRILELRGYVNDRGSSAKQLLETMAMQLG